MVAVAILFAAPAGSADLPKLESIRMGKTESHTRVVFDVSNPAKYQFLRLEAPPRAIIDLLQIEGNPELPTMSLQDTPISSINMEKRADGTVRYVFALREATETNVFTLKPHGDHGYRIVIDIETAIVDPPNRNDAGSLATAGWATGSAPGIQTTLPDNGNPGSSGGKGSTSSADGRLALKDKGVTPSSTADRGAPSSVDDLFALGDEDDTPARATDEGAPASADDLFGLGGTESSDNERPKKSGLEGFVQLESAYTYRSPTHLSKQRTILELGTDGEISDNISWKLSGRADYDAVFQLNNFYSSRVRDNREYDAQIYEAYLDASAGNLDFRLGRQHIIWGEMVGLFVADVVSAKDLRQFVAQDFDLIRIPQWAARAEYFRGDYHTEFIWVPVMTYNEIGKPGDDFYPLGTTLTQNPNVVIRKTEEPSTELSNSAYGMRVSTLKAGWDVSGFYYRSVDVEPTFFSEKVAAPEPALIFTPEHKKIHQLGTTLAKDLGEVVLKGEAVFTKDRWFVTNNPSDVDGLTQQDIVDYIVGLEHITPENTLLNFQIFQRWYIDHQPDNLLDEFETGVSLFSKLEINNTLDTELLLISQLNRTDWMVRPRVTWAFSTNWYLQFGADIFGGQEVSLFGRFENSSRVYTNVRYTF